jgi:hypothetical protein
VALTVFVGAFTSPGRLPYEHHALDAVQCLGKCVRTDVVFALEHHSSGLQRKAIRRF